MMPFSMILNAISFFCLLASEDAGFPRSIDDTGSPRSIDDTGEGASYRRAATPKEVVFSFGISLSFQHSCVNALSTCIGARRVAGVSHTECSHCRDALAGISYWKNVINSGVYLLNSGDRIIIDLVVKDDYGNETLMKANYEELGSWRSNTSTMTALFGPSFVEWNLAAAEIANRHNMLILLWAFETSNYLAYPFPQTADLTWEAMMAEQALSASTTLLNATANTSRRLFGQLLDISSLHHCQTTSDLADPACDANIANGMPSVADDDQHQETGSWQPGIIFRKDRNERELQEAALNGGVPCSEQSFMANPAFLVCSSDGSLNHGSVDFELTGILEDQYLDVLGVPRGTDLFSATFIPMASEYFNVIWDLELDRCIVGTGDSSCDTMMPSLDIQWKQYRGMSYSYHRAGPGVVEFMLSSTQATTTSMMVKMRNKRDYVSSTVVTGRLEYSYQDIVPCPENMVGCRPCAESTACVNGLYPKCNGTDAVTCSNEPNPDGEVWDYGFPNVFDVNYVKTTWALDAIDQLFQNGNRDFVFVYAHDVDWGSASGRQCETLAKYAASLNGTKVLLYYMGTQGTAMQDFRFLRLIGEDEAFVLCGSIHNAVSFTMGAKAFRLRASALVFDRPFGYPLIQQIKGFTANYLLEPMTMKYNTSQTCSVFESFAIFEAGFRATSFSFGDHVSYSTMQTVASGVVLINAMMNVDSTDVTSASSATSTIALKTYLQANTIATFFGDISFKAIGSREGRGSSTRQFVPAVGRTADPAMSYALSDINVVSNSIAPDLGYEPLLRSPHWLAKQLSVYPCVAGCSFEDNTCVPCEIGKVRSVDEIDCRPCTPGKFANTDGLSECASCPPGGECSTASVQPNRYYYPVQYQKQDMVRDIVVERMVERTCVDPNRIMNETSFTTCQPISVCIGGANPCVGTNIGLLCGACVDGESYYGLFQGRRRCNKCNHQGSILLRLFIIFVVLYMLGCIISAEAELAAADASSITCALLRTMFHFLHVLGFVIDATRLNSSTIIAAASIPLDILLRPLEFSQFDCLASDPVFDDAARVYSRGGIMFGPIWLAILLAMHLLRSLSGSAKLFLKLFVKCINRYCCSRRSDSADKDDAQIEDPDLAKPETGQTHGEEATIGRSALDALDAGGDTTKLRTEWSYLSGPGAHFASMHAGYDLQEQLRTYCRTCIVAVIFLYPIILYSGKAATNCLEVEGASEGKRLAGHLDLLCESEQYKDFASHHVLFHYIILCSVPLLLFVFNVLLRHEYFNLEWRRVVFVLHAGYTPANINWEVVMILRTGVICEAARATSLAGRCVVMGLVMVACMCLQVKYAPYEKTDREILHRLDLLGSASILVTLVIGAVCQFEANTFGEGGPPKETTQLILASVVVVLNLFVLLACAISYTFNGIVRELNVVICANTKNVDNSCKMLYLLMRRYRGMNPIGYSKRNGRHFIDVSKLDESERSFLGLILSDTMSACFDSGSHIQTWLLENAIDEGFTRAMQDRQERLRSYYYKNGSRNYHLFNFFNIVKLFKITLRPPDIPTEEKDKLHGYAIQDILAGRDHYDEWSSGVTVEELQTALATVNVDVLEHYPGIRRRPVRADGKKGSDAKATVAHEALVWNPGASLAWFEDYAKTWGSLVIGKEGKVEMFALGMGEVDQEEKRLAQDITEEFARKRKHMKEMYGIDLEDVDLSSSTCQRDIAQDEIKKINARRTELEIEFMRYSEEIVALKKELALDDGNSGGIGYQDSLSIMRRSEDLEPIPDKAVMPLPMSDAHGQSGIYTGPHHTDKAHGIGKLVYENGSIFIGQFVKGDLMEGVEYAASGNPKHTIAFGNKMEVLEASILQKYPIGQAFEEGDYIEALETIRTDSSGRIEISKGAHGVVKIIDKLGDALVRFDGIFNRQWILRENLHKFRMQAPWKLEIIGVDDAIDGEYDLQGTHNFFPAWQKVDDESLWLVRSSFERWAVKTREQKDDESLGSLLQARADADDTPLPTDVPKFQWQVPHGEEWLDRSVDVRVKAAQRWSLEHALVKEAVGTPKNLASTPCTPRSPISTQRAPRAQLIL